MTQRMISAALRVVVASDQGGSETTLVLAEAALGVPALIVEPSVKVSLHGAAPLADRQSSLAHLEVLRGDSSEAAPCI